MLYSVRDPASRPPLGRVRLRKHHTVIFSPLRMTRTGELIKNSVDFLAKINFIGYSSTASGPPVSLWLGHTRGKTTLSCFLRPSCRFATSQGKANILVTFGYRLLRFYCRKKRLRKPSPVGEGVEQRETDEVVKKRIKSARTSPVRVILSRA